MGLDKTINGLCFEEMPKSTSEASERSEEESKSSHSIRPTRRIKVEKKEEEKACNRD
jgi:hypothetical protein